MDFSEMYCNVYIHCIQISKLLDSGVEELSKMSGRLYSSIAGRWVTYIKVKPSFKVFLNACNNVLLI